MTLSITFAKRFKYSRRKMRILPLIVLVSYVQATYTPVYFLGQDMWNTNPESSPKPPCDENKFVDFLAKHQIANPENIIGLAVADLESTCPSTLDTIRKVDDYLKNCTANEGLYPNLLSGLRTLNAKLCKNSKFYKKYDKYSKCYTDLNKDYETCHGAADWSESSQDRVCKIYNKIIDCVYIKTAKVCGIKAALTLKELMLEVIDATLSVKCPPFSDPNISNAMPERYIDILNGCPPNSGNIIGIDIFIIISVFKALLQ
ncbi:uncharacterized protein [Euwallacea fornicatus]|uniref:uncharacterized protein n=1 Tax=Euwallacea fornicatus TaxID=995702 RepID=UPI00338F6C99